MIQGCVARDLVAQNSPIEAARIGLLLGVALENFANLDHICFQPRTDDQLSRDGTGQPAAPMEYSNQLLLMILAASTCNIQLKHITYGYFKPSHFDFKITNCTELLQFQHVLSEFETFEACLELEGDTENDRMRRSRALIRPLAGCLNRMAALTSISLRCNVMHSDAWTFR